MRPAGRLILLLAVICVVRPGFAADRVLFKLHEAAGRLEIGVDGKPFAEYVWKDEKIPRPYFRHVRAPGGIQATRNLPPVEGMDATDHDTMHPGIWLSFSDISGADFWRNKATTKLIEFVEPPDPETGSFTVRLEYRSKDRVICTENCRIVIEPTEDGTLIDWMSTFAGEKPFTFGDQEEMGLGIRMATPLAVNNGGTILNSDGLKDEAGVWGKTSKWCDYRGMIDGKPVGICLMPDKNDFRRSWFHVRNTGLMVANPFGRNAFTNGKKSAVAVKPGGDEFLLRFGILIHAGDFDPQSAYQRWVERTPP